MSKPKLYFAHPINAYDTELEQALLQRIAERFPDYEIINPNSPEHAAGYRAQGMTYFLNDILPKCDACVLLAFRDGMIGKGVYAEAATSYLCGHQVWEIFPDGTVHYWRLWSSRCLSVEDTRAHIHHPDGTIKPY
jgi:hypothetical protein